MVSTIASLGILVSANVAPAMKSMDEVGAKVKDVGETSQKEGKKTEGVMKRWGSSFAAIGAAATASLYMIVKASPLLSGAIREAQDSINLLFMTIGDALEPVIRPFVDALWELSDLIIDMPSPFNTLTAALIALGGSITAVLGGLVLLPTLLHAVGLSAGAAASGTLLLATSFFGIITAAGLVAVALYYLSGEPTIAIIGALTTIGVGASVLMHHPVVFAITSIVSAFVLMTGEMGNMETLASAAFLTIGVGATALLFHPVVAAITGIAGAIGILMTSSADLEIKMIAVFAAIGIAAAALLSNPVIAAVTAIIVGIALLMKAWKDFQSEFEITQKTVTIGGVEYPGIYGVDATHEELEHARKFNVPVFYQYGGYVPYTGPAMLEAGEYVVPAGRVGVGVGGGAIYNITNNFEINNPILGSDMDVDRMKQRLDELYRIEMGRVA